MKYLDTGNLLHYYCMVHSRVSNKNANEINLQITKEITVQHLLPHISLGVPIIR